MKRIVVFILIFVSMAMNVFSQDKMHFDAFNSLKIVAGSPYVIAMVVNWSKIKVRNDFLVFINSESGELRRIDFPKGADISKIEQIKIDSLNINKVLLVAKTVDIDNKGKNGWRDCIQLLACSPDGKELVKITNDRFFVAFWMVNEQNGTVIITGHYDTNNNGKYDKADRSEIAIFDLKTMKLIPTQ